MKIVLLDTGRGVNPETIRMWRENLELADTDEVALMAWQPPREPLPVTEHYVFGPRLSLKNTEPRHVQTVGDLFGGHDIDAARMAEESARGDAAEAASGLSEDDDPDISEIGGDDSPVSESDLAGQMTEAVSEEGRGWTAAEFDTDNDADAPGEIADAADPVLTATEAAPVPDADAVADAETEVPHDAGQPDSDGTVGDAGFVSPADAPAELPTAPVRKSPTNAAHQKVAGLPVYHPQRVAHAVRWRGTKAVRTGKKTARQVTARSKKALKVGNSPVAKAAQRAIATRNGSIATQFAIALSRSREAAELFRSADLVFPVDARSQRGAWLLARAHKGPDVMVGYPAAIRALNKRRGRA